MDENPESSHSTRGLLNRSFVKSRSSTKQQPESESQQPTKAEKLEQKQSRDSRQLLQKKDSVPHDQQVVKKTEQLKNTRRHSQQQISIKPTYSKQTSLRQQSSTLKQQGKETAGAQLRHKSGEHGVGVGQTGTPGMVADAASDLIQGQVDSSLLSAADTSGLGVSSTMDEVDGGGDGSADSHKVKVAMDRIQGKIERAKQLIEREQMANEENVKEYLAQASVDQAAPSPSLGPLSVVTSIGGASSAARIKAGFERKNQKSVQTITHLQRKLDEYNRRMEEIRASGCVNVGGSGSQGGHGHRPAKNVLRDVGQGLKDFFVRDAARSREASPCRSRDESANSQDARSTQPSSVSKSSRDGTRVRNGSSDNILITYKVPLVNTQMSDDKSGSGKDVVFDRLRDGSDEEVSHSSIKSNLSDSASGEFHLSPQRSRQSARAHQSNASDGAALVNDSRADDSSRSADQGRYSDLLNELQENRKTQQRLQTTFDNLRARFESESIFYHQIVEEERERSERLEDQVNDLAELHLNEITNIKQELASMQEKIEYQLDERTRDMQELLESCQTKISKMEMQQHQQQLISMEGIENFNLRAILTKLINVMLAILGVILILVSTLANFLGPFLANRFRIVCTVCLVACIVAALDNWPVICDMMEKIGNRYGFKLFRT